MLYKIRTGIARHVFDRSVRRVLTTDPVSFSNNDSDPLILSQVCHKDMLMYLLSMKTFTKFVRPRSIIVLNDGSLTLDDCTVLRKHIDGVRILSIANISSRFCPRGVCWERLLVIADEVENGYVIQLDADTLTLDCPTEVIEAIADGRCFTLGSKGTAQPLPVVQVATTSRAYLERNPRQSHVQHLAESSLDHLPGAETLLYVRGCAGFAGFARSSFDRSTLEQFSQWMTTLVGINRWSSWGSDQVSSNFIIANSPRPEILPFARYDSFRTSEQTTNKVFLHFIGTQRFQGGVYSATARQVLAKELFIPVHHRD